ADLARLVVWSQVFDRYKRTVTWPQEAPRRTFALPDGPVAADGGAPEQVPQRVAQGEDAPDPADGTPPGPLARLGSLRGSTRMRHHTAHRSVRKRLATDQRTRWTPATLAPLLDTLVTGGPDNELVLLVCEHAPTDLLRTCADELTALLERLRTTATDLGEDLDDEFSAFALPEGHLHLVRVLVRARIPVRATDLLHARDPYLAHPGVPEALARPDVLPLLIHLLDLNGTRPTKAWSRLLDEHLAAVEDPADLLHRLLEPLPRTPAHHGGHYAEPTHFSPVTAELARGLVWAVAALPAHDTPWAPSVLERIAVFTGTGPGGSKRVRAERLTTACVGVLARRGGDGAVSSLSRIRSRVRKKTVLSGIDRALGGLADALGIGGEELVDRTVPDHGLGPDGTRAEPLGGHTAVLSVAADGTAALSFRDPAGRTPASAPAEVRREHPERLRELRAELKELRATLATGRARAETLLAEGRVLTAGSWVRHHLDHPVTGVPARRMLWEVGDGADRVTGAVETEGGDGDEGGKESAWRLVAADGSTLARIADLDPAAPVRAWHPARSTPDRVRAWRDRFAALEIAQPVRQAHRETYLLTPAEEETGTHSDRFTGRVLDYDRAKALLGARGWTVGQLGGWDGGQDALAERVYRDLGTGTGWRVTLTLAAADEPDDQGRIGRCAAGPVRFHRADPDRVRSRPARPLPSDLAHVPALVLSEVMRDVDLAVGVASADVTDPTDGTAAAGPSAPARVRGGNGARDPAR
ncbi:DUF4132 domain-containing protein, partial [Nocardiopsis protaetiae]|uniref:DUF4132 domain-containing protein n=1 Tax=Nocardiopsis protaetiae TaxID=3382270 RepID=UPI00387B8C6F